MIEILLNQDSGIEWGSIADWLSAIASCLGVYVSYKAFRYARKAFDGQKEALDQQKYALDEQKTQNKMQQQQIDDQVKIRQDDEQYRRSMEFFNLIRVEGDKFKEAYNSLVKKGLKVELKLNMDNIWSFYSVACNFIRLISMCQGHIGHEDVGMLFRVYIQNFPFCGELTVGILLPFEFPEDKRMRALGEWREHYNNAMYSDWRKEEREHKEYKVKEFYKVYFQDYYKQHFPEDNL